MASGLEPRATAPSFPGKKPRPQFRSAGDVGSVSPSHFCPLDNHKACDVPVLNRRVVTVLSTSITQFHPHNPGSRQLRREGLRAQEDVPLPPTSA